MGFNVNTNLDALNTYRNLSNVQNSLSNSLAKLSSGLRINNAGDDAAGLTIATQLGSQVSGLTQAARNAQDGTSVVQTADGALTQAQSLLGRLRDLAVQAANDSNSVSARTAIATEATSITDELTRLGNSVNFNGKNLLDGSSATLNFQVGADGTANNQISVSLASANLITVANTLANGTTSSGESFTGGVLANVTGNVDFTSGTGGNTTTATVNFSSAPTSWQNMVDTLNANSSFSAGFVANVVKDSNGAATGIQFDTAAHAQLAIQAIDTQLAGISSARANIGALENRFTSAVSTINTSITNLTAAKSRITDVDMASEMVNYSRANILSQSGTAMLAQANSLPQLALKLLG